VTEHGMDLSLAPVTDLDTLFAHASETEWRGDPADLLDALLVSVDHRPAWHARAACRDLPLEWLFPSAKAKVRPEVRAACARCTVAVQCLDAAGSVGVWGGLSERERRTDPNETAA
jgi:hypothetical protein